MKIPKEIEMSNEVKLSNKMKNLVLKPKKTESKLHLMDFPAEVLNHVASYTILNDLKNFGLTNKRCNKIRKEILKMKLIKCVDLRKVFDLNEEEIWERVNHLKYKSLNLKHCYYWSPGFITQLVSRESVGKLNLIECNCTLEVIKAVVKLNLTSLSISLSKTWIAFFVLNENKSVAVLNKLQDLEIYHQFGSRLLMTYVCRYVLPHCHQLQSLTLLTPPSLFEYEGRERHKVFQFPNLISTPVPKLKKLVLNFHNYDDLTPFIKSFLEIILRGKTIPLTNVYLGKQSLKAFFSGILSHEMIALDEADTLCGSHGNFSICEPSDFNFNVIANSTIDSIYKCTKYKTIVVENSTIPDCSIFETFVNSRNTSIKEINLSRSRIEKGICSFINEISNLSPGITIVNLSLADWSQTENFQQINSDLMNSLANLTNLRTLYLASAMLSHNTSEEEEALKSSFCKVTKECEYLEDLRIIGNTHRAFLQNLQKLRFVNFDTIGNFNPNCDLSIFRNNYSLFPKIVESCTKLKYLHIDGIFTEIEFEELVLVHSKQIKRLHFSRPFNLTKTFVDNLRQCTELEKLFIHPSCEEWVQMEEVKYYANSFKNLKKLTYLNSIIVSCASQHHVFNDYLRSVNEEIKETRPSFYFVDYDKYDELPPMVHHKFLLRQK